MPNRRLYAPALSLLVLVALGSGLLSACTSGDSSGLSPDSTHTATAKTVAQTPTAGPAALAPVEKNDTRTVAEKLEDASIEARVKQSLIRASSLRVFPFRPTVIEGHLVLRGDVNTPSQYRRAEQIGASVEGVTAVTNKLTMGGRPVTDERLASASEEDEENGAAVYHTVRQGDTLWDIARQYRASVRQIQNLNDLRSSNLRPGQRIRVR